MNLLELQVLLVVSGVPEGARESSLLDWVTETVRPAAPGRPDPVLAQVVGRLMADDPQFSPPV